MGACDTIGAGDVVLVAGGVVLGDLSERDVDRICIFTITLSGGGRSIITEEVARSGQVDGTIVLAQQRAVSKLSSQSAEADGVGIFKKRDGKKTVFAQFFGILFVAVELTGREFVMGEEVAFAHLCCRN